MGWQKTVAADGTCIKAPGTVEKDSGRLGTDAAAVCYQPLRVQHVAIRFTIWNGIRSQRHILVKKLAGITKHI